MKKVHEMDFNELVELIQETENQELINRLALEITYRLYVPFKSKTFEELLIENGYRIIEENKNKNK